MDYTTHCPYCAAVCECDLADVGVGFVQCGPYHCEVCGAIECGAYDSPEDQARRDPKTGWFPPSEDPRPGSSANMLNGRLASSDETRAAYRDRFAGSPDYDKPGLVEGWFASQRGPRIMSGWSKPAAKWDWRAFLTEDEASHVAAADAAKAEWQRLQAIRAGIQNRAIQRAKFAAGRPAPVNPPAKD